MAKVSEDNFLSGVITELDWLSVTDDLSCNVNEVDSPGMTIVDLWDFLDEYGCSCSDPGEMDKSEKDEAVLTTVELFTAKTDLVGLTDIILDTEDEIAVRIIGNVDKVKTDDDLDKKAAEEFGDAFDRVVEGWVAVDTE